MRWRLTGAEGVLAGVPLDEILDNGGVLPGAPRETALRGNHAGEPPWFAQLIRRCQGSERPTWVILPDSERKHRDYWQELATGDIELGFGRAGVTLVLSQINRLRAPATLVAMDQTPGTQPDTVVESWSQLALEPSDAGLGLALSLVDGRLDGEPDLTSLLAQAQGVTQSPAVMFMPGSGSDGYLDRLMPSLSAMGNWVAREVRWEFAEARIGALGVAGSLFNWYWLHEGYRLGDWQGPAVVLDMDTSPLVGLSVVDFTA